MGNNKISQPSSLSAVCSRLRPGAILWVGSDSQLWNWEEKCRISLLMLKMSEAADNSKLPLLPFLSNTSSNWLYPLQNTFYGHFNLDSTEGTAFRKAPNSSRLTLELTSHHHYWLEILYNSCLINQKSVTEFI